MSKTTSLKKTIILSLIIPVMIFIIVETALSYYVTLHYVDKTYDRWLLDSARSLIQEVKIIDDRINVDLPATTLEIFKWDDVDTMPIRLAHTNTTKTGVTD